MLHPWLDALCQDIRYGVRGLRRSPGNTTVAVLTLALGLGATTTTFSIVDAVLLRPLPFVDQERLVIVWEKDEAGGKPLIEVSFPNYLDWQRETTSFDSLAAIGSVNWGSDVVGVQEPYSVSVGAVSTSFFETLGVSAAHGRTFLPEEDLPDAGRVVVVSHGLWQERLNADRGVVGRAMIFEGETGPQSFTIVGVMPREFDFPRGADVWMPVGRILSDIARQNGFSPQDERGLGVLYVIGRLGRRVPIEQATADLDTIVPSLHVAHFGSGEQRRVVVTPLVEHIFGATQPALLMLHGAVVFFLLIACANVAGLLIVKSIARGRELAVRQALGASRGRLARHHLVEGGLIAAGGALAGCAFAAGLLKALPALAPPDVPRLDEVALDTRVWLFAIAATLLTMLIVGMGPAAIACRLRSAESLKAGGPTATDGAAGTRWRNGLVVIEVAMALPLLVGAGLLARSFVNLLQADLGFRPENVLTLSVELPDARYPTYRQRRAFYRDLLERVERLPNVAAAAGVFQRPLEHGPIGLDGGFILEGQSVERATFDMNPTVNVESVTPEYFRAIGTRLLRGRTFTHRDTVDAPSVVIVSESLAREAWPGQDPIGKRLLGPHQALDAQGTPLWKTVVGVVEDVRYREIETPRLDLYLPFYQTDINANQLVVRTASDPLAMSGAVREIVRDLDPNQIVDGVTTMEAVVARAMRPWRFNAMLFGWLATLALALAGIGLFTALAATVALRTRELGIRIALGANAYEIFALVLRGGCRVIATGAALGLLLAVALSRGLSRLLFGVEPIDPLTLAASTGVLVAVGLVATLVPARRATSVDPMAALRTD